MPLFKCSKCGCIENTATSNYWGVPFDEREDSALCTECDPQVGKWHGLFEKKDADKEGYKKQENGFYSKDV